MKEKAGVMKPPMTPNTKPSIYMFLNERREGRKKEASKVKHVHVPWSDIIYMVRYSWESAGFIGEYHSPSFPIAIREKRQLALL